MFQVDAPPGVPDYDTPRSRHALILKKSDTFAHLDPLESGALFDSLCKTVERCAYHGLRFDSLRSALEERRRNLPGEVLWDGVVAGLHFELQAMSGAARVALDELIYVIARRHRVDPRRASQEPWAASSLIPRRCRLDRHTNVEEVRELRKRADWFDTLNAYRNSFFHNGWRHGGGHFDADDTRAASKTPSMNALLVPDRSSLRSRSKPHEWTYDEGRTVDSMAETIRNGLDQALRAIFEGPWRTPEPAPGRLPRSEHPNVIVVLVVPAVVETPTALIIPMFSTEDRARQCPVFQGASQVEVVRTPVSTAVVGQAAVSFSLTGLESSTMPAGIHEIHLVLDPEPQDAEWRRVNAKSHAILKVEDLRSAGFHMPISLPVTNLEYVFLWRRPLVHDWTL
jgi:hypothetical protein